MCFTNKKSFFFSRLSLFLLLPSAEPPSFISWKELIAVLAAELPWRSASVFHKVSVKVEGALHNRFAPSHSRLKKYCKTFEHILMFFFFNELSYKCSLIENLFKHIIDISFFHISLI